MVIRRDLIIVSLTFCLTVTLFMIGRVSGPAYQPYDAWTDTNGNGRIDSSDLNQLLTQYGATGDPTRNVNITNWPQDAWELRLVYNQSLGFLPYMTCVYVTTIDVSGYRTVTVHARATGTWQDRSGIWIRCCWNSFGIEASDSSNPEFVLSVYVGQPDYFCGLNTLTVRSTKLDLYIMTGGLDPPTEITLMTIAVFLQK